MGRLDDFTIDQLAGSLALVVSSLGGFMLIMFKSRCTSLCCGMCIRDPLPPGEDEENPGPYAIPVSQAGSTGTAVFSISKIVNLTGAFSSKKLLVRHFRHFSVHFGMRTKLRLPDLYK